MHAAAEHDPRPDGLIRHELERADPATGEWRHDVGALLRMHARENHALRAILDECRVLDRDPDTEQIAEDLRTIIAQALHLDHTTH